MTTPVARRLCARVEKNDSVPAGAAANASRRSASAPGVSVRHLPTVSAAAATRLLAATCATVGAIEHAHEALLHQVDDEIDDTLLVKALATIAAIAPTSLVLAAAVTVRTVTALTVSVVPVMPVTVTVAPVMPVIVTVALVLPAIVAVMRVTVVPSSFVPEVFLSAFERCEPTLDPAQLFENALEYFAFHRTSGSTEAAGAARRPA